MQTVGTTPPQAESRTKLKRSIIDCDIHHYTAHEYYKDYLPRRYLESPPRAAGSGGGGHFNGGVGGRMVDAIPEDGSPAGSDLSLVQSQLLDPFNVEYGILTGDSFGLQSMADGEHAAAIAAAVNDYTIEQWLARDGRLRGSILVAKQVPHLAAAEIDRVGGRSDMVQVFVSSGAMKPHGNRFYDPIFEACCRYNLPFTIHVGVEGNGIHSPETGAGRVAHYIETRALRPQNMMAHLVSFIFEGVFERFPDLKVVLQEAGVFWVVPCLWQMDQHWHAERAQLPLVKKPPSEYFRKHVRVTTQPIEATPNRAIFDKMLASLFAEETLMFCSDYPHWDFDSPQLALPRLEEKLWDRIFYRNAAELYGLPDRGTGIGGKQS
ncbi:amidohydrolase [Paenibacillus hemerocallicola]|uniref:Amidohydrolase n=1 Tax=Paenibacillus hemerocallicola TaxID=1172614 RepID=A0A5C4T4H2_9BACL|nr:amidohydrolase family protein [Paenibacillus hemerocallicola]TNJ63978.1 amidohydrolase [Paenibacillus hemerocallicola]